MNIARFHDWPERLAQYLADNSSRPFEWGTYDCCLFAANVFEVLTGVDPAKELRGTYSSARQAAVILSEHGCMEALVEELLQPFAAETVPVLCAQRGDVVLVKNHSQVLGEYALAIVGMDGKLVIPAEHGLISIPLNNSAIKAWRI
jgi:hypothetical protein